MASKKNTIECICPKCGATHKMNLLWTGRGKPRKYCQNCKSTLSTTAGFDFHGSHAKGIK